VLPADDRSTPGWTLPITAHVVTAHVVTSQVVLALPLFAVDRLPAYGSITTPVLVIGFADDVVMPPYLGAEWQTLFPTGSTAKSGA
jgi:pimeloyl-ACP methyl ester carboxylesterase